MKSFQLNFKITKNCIRCFSATQDLNFNASFALKFKRKDLCHALVGYFECAFTQVHNQVIFSTSPFTRYTHWKQTVFYLEEDVAVHANEVLRGTIAVSANDRNPRDLDIKIKVQFEGAEMNSEQDMFFRLR